MRGVDAAGYSVVLIFIGLNGAAISDQRVAMRVAGGGHDVPRQKLTQRFSRTMKNLRHALVEIAGVMVIDHSDLEAGYRVVLLRRDGVNIWRSHPLPKWLKPLVPRR